VFKCVKDSTTGADRWTYLAHKSPHTHDVRALATAQRGAHAEELLLSGGVDGQLVLYPAHRILEVGGAGGGEGGCTGWRVVEGFWVRGG